MQQRIYNFQQWQEVNLLQEAKRSKGSSGNTRRDFLKLLLNVGVSGIAGLTLAKIWKMVKNDYDDEDGNDFKDGYLLRLSDTGRNIIEEFYEESIPNFEDQLKIAEAELLIIFDDWVSKGINCRLSQKMYDALVMIAVRWGRTNFRMSQFIQEVKNQRFNKAVEELKMEKIDMWYLKDLKEIKKIELELFSSFGEIEDKESSVTAGPSTGRKKPRVKEEDSDFVTLRNTSYSRVKYDLDRTQFDKVYVKLLDDLQLAAERADIVVTITTAKSGHSRWSLSGYESRHFDEIAVDIAIINGQGSGNASNYNNGNPEFRRLGNKLKDELVKMGYVWNSEKGREKAVLWQTDLGGNHFNHLHVSRKLD